MQTIPQQIKSIEQLPPGATFEDIKKVVDRNTSPCCKHLIIVGDRSVIAFRKYTWQGNVAKTAYLHVYHVNTFEAPVKVLHHWREQKDGTFKPI